MKINPSIFRTYDIRGIYPSEVNEEIAYWLGCAFVKFIGIKKGCFVIGRDNRFSSFALSKKLIEGVTDCGVNVIDIGLAPTPTFYWSVNHFKTEGGIQVSASHNPAQYNGFKLVRKKAVPISFMTGLKEIKKIKINSKVDRSDKKGRFIKKDITEKYVASICKKIDLKDIAGFKIVVDTANAVSGILIPYFKKNCPIKIHHIFSQLDGCFPNHSPDPTLKENLVFLKKEVKRKKADLGVAFDGDGDRIVFIDEKGEQVRGDFITAIIAEELLKNNKGARILYETRSSKVVRETIEKCGGLPILGRPGHSLIKEQMRREDILFAGELSGHYYFKENGFFESPLSVMLYILKIINEEKLPLSRIVKKFRVYYQSGEINFKVKNKEETIRKIKLSYQREAKKILLIDGITVEFENWWFNLRPSGTEDLLRLNIEADTKDLLNKKRAELVRLLKR